MCRFVILLFVALPLMAKVELRRGSIAVLHKDDAVSMMVAGEDPFKGEKGTIELPVYLGGIFNVRGNDQGSVFLRSSSGMDFYFTGPGFFGVDRFDQIFSGADVSPEAAPEQTRMIMNLREGRLTLDSRQLPGEKQILLETPFGRIAAPGALWSIVIEYDYRSQRYDFTVSSVEGTVRLTDWQNQSYTLYAGQRLAGAGAYSNPAIEIGEPTDDSLERIENFLSLRQTLRMEALDPELFWGQMIKLDEAVARTESVRVDSGRRPLVIEFSPAPEALTPYRGIIRPREHSQDDLF